MAKKETLKVGLLDGLTVDQKDEAIKVELEHPANGEPLGVFLFVVSSESDQSQQFLARQMRKEQMRELENNKRRQPKFKELDELKADARAMAVSRLTGWENVSLGGEELAFNAENAEKLLTKCPWIIEQIFEHSNDLGKFYK